MQICRRVSPFPRRNHDIALDSLRPLGLGERQLAARDAIGPVPEQVERVLGVQPRDVAGHEIHRAAGLKTLRPGFGRGFEIAEFLVDRAHSRGPERVAGLAGTGLHDIQPFALTLDFLQRELAFGRHLQQRKPVNRRIVLRRRSGIRCRHRGQVQHSAGRRLNFGRVHQAVAAHPNHVICSGKIRDNVSSSIVCNDDLGEFGRTVGCFRDNPDAGLRTIRSGHRANNIVAADADCRVGILLSVHPRQRNIQKCRDGDRCDA